MKKRPFTQEQTKALKRLQKKLDEAAVILASVDPHAFDDLVKGKMVSPIHGVGYSLSTCRSTLTLALMPPDEILDKLLPLTDTIN